MGCLPLIILIFSVSFISGLIYSFSWPIWASEQYTSNSAISWALVSIVSYDKLIRFSSVLNKEFSNSIRFSRACNIIFSCSFNSVVVNRSPFVRVCFLS